MKTTVITLSGNANEPHIKAAFDAAVTAKIFEQPLTVFIFCPRTQDNVDDFYVKVEKNSRTFIDNFGDDCIERIHSPEDQQHYLREAFSNAHCLLSF